MATHYFFIVRGEDGFLVAKLGINNLLQIRPIRKKYRHERTPLTDVQVV